MKKRINWKRGILRSAFLLSIISLFILGVLFINSPANAGKSQEFIEVNVKSGDSLWLIAARYDNNNIDLRKLIYEIKEINKIEDTIYPGQVLFIPTY